jgi:SM-20-related protein
MGHPDTKSAPLGLDLIRNAELARRPWPHCILTGAITDPATLDQMVASFPDQGFQMARERDPDAEGKTYEVAVRNDLTGTDLDPVWQPFIAQLQSEDYRRAVGHLGGVTLQDSQCVVAFYRYPPQTWLGPHRDNRYKILTHVFYFNAAWPAAAGGDLLILDSPDPGNVQHRVSPTTGTSVVIVRGENSWHAVEKVSDEITQTRLSVSVVFYTADADLTKHVN